MTFYTSVPVHTSQTFRILTPERPYNLNGCAGLVRTHGAEVAEVPVLAVRPELEGNGLGRALLAQLESALLAAGVKLLVMPAVSQLPPTATSQVSSLSSHH